MENTKASFGFTDNKLDLDYQFEIQDQSLLFKLRRSCERIEELMKECGQLRRENDMQHKIIANLQDRQRETCKVVEDMRETIALQNIQISDYSKKICHIQLQQVDNKLQQDFNLLLIRYRNCQEENIILRQQVKQRNTEIELAQTDIRELQTKNKALSQQIKLMKGQIHLLMGKQRLYQVVRKQLEQLRQVSMKRDLSMQMSLGEYRSLIAAMSQQIGVAMKEQQLWHRNFSDLTETVEMIQDLREAHKQKRLIKSQ